MPLNIDWQQILLHLLNFAILAGGLYFLLYKPVKQFIGQRESHYKDREDAAKQTEADAEALKAQYQDRLRHADEEILHLREEVSEEVEAEKQHLLAEAREQARGIISTATQTAELRTRKAMEDSDKEIRNLAVDMVEKLVLKSGGDALDQFLDQAEGEGKKHGK